MNQSFTSALIVLMLLVSGVMPAHAQNPDLLVKAPQQNNTFHPEDTREMLFSQLGDPSDEAGIHSQYYVDYSTYTCQAADDFTVPAGIPWLISTVSVTGYYSPDGGIAEWAHVYIFENQNGAPGPQIHFYYELPVSADSSGNLEITLDPPLELPEGHYWLSVQPVMSFLHEGQWFWSKQAGTAGFEYHWRNPGGGFGIPGSDTWLAGSQIDWGGGSQNDLNLSFALFGQPAETPPVIEIISDQTAYPGKNIRILGADFGEQTADAGVEINNILYTDIITYWTNNRVHFNLPDLPEGPADIRLIKSAEMSSEIVTVNILHPTEVIFLTPNEGEVISGNYVEIAAAAEIYQDLISAATFYYRAASSGTWIPIGTDSDGTSKHYSTTQPIGSGNGWSLVWDVSDIAEMNVDLKVEMEDEFGRLLTGQRSIRIDKTPLAPEVNIGSSETFAGKALDNDSISFELEVSEENTGEIELRWAPPPIPAGGWTYERELEPIDQYEVEFIDRNGNDVSGMACGPSAMASCLKWLAQRYPESQTAGMTVEELAQKLARDANTGSDGTSDADLEQAARDQLDNDPGITTGFDVDHHFNRPPTSTEGSHNVYHDIAASLRDSADVVMLLYQVGPDDDTLGHFVTASSHQVEISYVATAENCAAVQTSYVDFMDPASGERVDKIINWYDNPPQIQDYDLHPGAQGNAWVERVITIKPTQSKTSRNSGELITQIPVNGPGTYQVSVSSLNLPEGVQIIEIQGVDTDGNASAAPLLACANGPYQPVSNFTAEPETFITGYPIQFTDLSNPSDSIVSWLWDFGDTNTSSERNPEHTYSETGTYSIRLIVSDGNLYDTLVRETYIGIIEATEQTIVLEQGWHGISSYVEPVNTDIEQVMQPVIDEMIILQEMNNIFWPVENINTIGNWNSHKGYKIKMATQASLELRGLEATDNTLDLTSGWSIFPVLSECTVPTSVITSQFGQSLVIMKDIAGTGVLWPEQGINTLNVLTPGSAYMIYLDSENQITFPACAAAGAVENPQESTPEGPWNDVTATAESHIISIGHNIDGLSNGVLIGAFDSGGLCCGITKVDANNPAPLVVFADDPLTPSKDGMAPDEKITYRLYIPSTRQTFVFEPGFDVSFPDGFVFKEDGISVMNAMYTATASETLLSRQISVYPSPASTIIYISGLPASSEILLYDLYGRISKHTDQPGNGTVEIDVRSLQPGIYLLHIISGGETFIRKIAVE